MSIKPTETQDSYSIHISWRDPQIKDAQSGWSKLEKKGPWSTIPTHLGQMFSHTKHLSSIRVNKHGSEETLLHYVTLQEKMSGTQQTKDSQVAAQMSTPPPKKEDKQHILNTLFALTCSHINEENLNFDAKHFYGLSLTNYLNTLKRSIRCLKDKGEQEEFKPLLETLTRMINIGSCIPFQKKNAFMDAEVENITKIIQNLSSKDPPVFLFGGTVDHAVIYKIKKEKNGNTYSLSIYNTGLMSSHVLHPATVIFSEEKIKAATQFKIKGINKTKISTEFIELLIGCCKNETQNMKFIYDYIATRFVKGFGNDQDVEGKGSQVAFKFKNYENDLHQPQKHGTCTVSSMQLVIAEVLPDPQLRAKLKLLQIRYLIDKYGLERLKKHHPGLYSEVIGKVGYLIQKTQSTFLSEMPEWQEETRPMSNTHLVQDWKAVDKKAAQLRKKWKAERA